jgi:iron complex outermembrane receptor protein
MTNIYSKSNSITMAKFYFRCAVVTALLLSSFSNSFGQSSRLISGVVTSSSDGAPVPGANVTIKGTETGSITDADGKFSVKASGQITLTVSFIGYVTQDVTVLESTSVVNVVLQNSVTELQEVIVSVGRGSERTLTDTPLPVDNFTAKELASTGQPTFDRALQYKVPSFNTVMTPVNDATSLLDPYEIRSMGPSRTLILINGKRKNLSSLVYVQTSPGRGETGADLSAIPQDAIKRVEILRDGASAQYGSDAIAGVMNIILKDKFDAPTLRVNAGVTSKGDGGNYSINYNSGANIGSKGYVNYHVSFQRQQRAIRSGNIDPVQETDSNIGFGDASGGDMTNGTGTITPTNQSILNFLKVNPTGGNINGTADNTSAKFLVNTAIPLSDKTEFYANAAYVYRKALSFANYRVPYWKLDYGTLHTPDPSKPDYTGTGNPLYNGYMGYAPTFEGDLNDYNATAGIRTTSENGWKQDMSLTVGGNKMLFGVNNTVNHSMITYDQAHPGDAGWATNYGPNSFKPGGFAFNHMVGNIDISKNIGSRVFVGFGTEFRSENWQEIAGDTASYYGQGANSFTGYRSWQAVKASRFNIGGYGDLGFDITDNFFIGVTGRSERYSDFGNTNIGKITSRLKLLEGKLILRGSASNGFRAPTVAQYNVSLDQASFSSGQIVIQRVANNYSREASALDIPKLKPETSTNYTAGLGLNPTKDFSLTFDYYFIDIKDRIVYSHPISAAIVKQYYPALDPSVVGVSFFINGAHTQTQGLDIVGSYRNIPIGNNILNLNFAGNYLISNDIIKDANGNDITTPKKISDLGGKIYTATEKALMLTSRPKYKYIVGAELNVGKFNFYLNNTLFGPTYFSNNDLSDLDGTAVGTDALDGKRDLQVQFKTKVLTDLTIGYAINSKLNISATISNIFNVYPQWELVGLTQTGKNFLKDPSQAINVELLKGGLTFNNRYAYTTYDGAHFSQLGTTFLGQLVYKF